MPKPRALHAWLPDTEIINGITNSGFKLDLLEGELPSTARPGERKVHTSCSGRTASGTNAGFKSAVGERKVHTSCSGRTSAVLRKLRYTPGCTPESKPSEGSSCQTRLPYTPDGSGRSYSGGGTNLSGLTPDGSTPLRVLREGAYNGFESQYAAATVGPSVLGQRSGPLERIIQPVLLARAVEDCMGPPGSPPRRGGLRKLRDQQVRDLRAAFSGIEESQAGNLFTNGESELRAIHEPPQESLSSDCGQSSGSKPWPGATPSTEPRCSSVLSDELSEELMLASNEDLPDQQQTRAQTPLDVRETIHCSRVFGKGCIFRGTFDTGVLKVEQDRKDLADHRRAVEKAAKEDNRASVVKWAAVHHRRQQVYQLRGLASDPDVRSMFIPKDAPCDGSGGHATPAELTQQELAELAHAPARVEMPATVHSKDALFHTEEEVAAAAKLKKKQNLQARLKVLKRVAKERRIKEMEKGEEDPEALKENDHLESFFARGKTKTESETPRGSSSARSRKSIKSPRMSQVVDDEQADQKPSASSDSPRASRSSLLKKRVGKERLSLTTKLGIKGNSGPPSPDTPSSPISVRHQRQQNRSAQMMAIRERAFTDQVAKHHTKEMQQLQEVFGQHDVDGNHALDHGEMRACLATLGIVGKNQAERKVVRKVLWEMDKLLFDVTDLTKHIVPALRKALIEERRPRLLELFLGMDRLGRGKLSIEETFDGLRRLGMQIRDEIKDKVVSVFCYEEYEDWVQSSEEPILGHDEFVSFVSILGEQVDRHKAELFRSVSGKLNLSDEEKRFWELDLVDMYCQFHEYDPVSGKYGSSAGKLTESEFTAVVRASGYMPKTRAKQIGVTQSFNELQRADGTIGFEGFLSIMRRLRDYDRERLWRILDNWLHDAVVTFADITAMLPECGIVCRNLDEEKEVHAMMEEYDEDGIGIFCAQECVPLLQQMSRKMRVIQHERERQYVMSAGWSLHHFVEFRHVFQAFDEDMSEFLDCDELMKAVELLRGSYWQSQQNIDLMFVALGIDTSKDIKVNFFTFLRMMKMLDDSETRRQQGASVGFSRDRTDTLYSIFQALEPESDGTLSRRLLEQVVIGLSESLTKTQIKDLVRIIIQFPLHIEFRSFLRLMKTLDGMIVEINLDILQEGMRKGQKSNCRWTDLTKATADRRSESPVDTP